MVLVVDRYLMTAIIGRQRRADPGLYRFMDVMMSSHMPRANAVIARELSSILVNPRKSYAEN